MILLHRVSIQGFDVSDRVFTQQQIVISPTVATVPATANAKLT